MLELAGSAARFGDTERDVFVVRKSLGANALFEFAPAGEFDDDVLVGEDVSGENPEQIAFDLAINFVERVLSQDSFFGVAFAEQPAIRKFCETAAHGQHADGTNGVELRARAAHRLLVGSVRTCEQVDTLGDAFLTDDATAVVGGGGPKDEYQEERNNADRLFHIGEIGKPRARLSRGRLQPVTTFVTSTQRRRQRVQLSRNESAGSAGQWTVGDPDLSGTLPVSV